MNKELQKIINDVEFYRNLYLEAEADGDTTTMFIADVRLKELNKKAELFDF